MKSLNKHAPQHPCNRCSSDPEKCRTRAGHTESFTPLGDARTVNLASPGCVRADAGVNLGTPTLSSNPNSVITNRKRKLSLSSGNVKVELHNNNSADNLAVSCSNTLRTKKNKI